jgi:hypothetical protein
MTVQLIGRDDVAISTPNFANYILMTKYTASASGSVTELRFRAVASTTGNVTIGMYADSGGEPTGNPLGQKAVAVSSGAERVITVTLDSPISVVSGTAYWIAYNSDATLVGAKQETAVRRYKSAAYAALPSPVGTGYTPETTYSDITSGWGNLPPRSFGFIFE